MLRISIVSLLFFKSGLLFAQPSAAEVKKQMLSAPNALSCEITGNGTRSWNSDYNNWEYATGVEVVYRTEWPGIKVKATGSAVYESVGGNQYKYRKMRVAENEYLGIPNPSSESILALIEKNPISFYTPQYYEIVEILESPRLAAKPNWFWHKPTSVSCQVFSKYCILSSYTTIDTVEDIREIRLYRDDMQSEWNRFIATAGTSEQRKVTGTASYNSEVLQQLKNALADAPMTGKQWLAQTPQRNTPMQAAPAMEKSNWNVGEEVLVLEGKKWYPATILEAKPNQWFIHYLGYDVKYDTWVGPDRIKAR